MQTNRAGRIFAYSPWDAVPVLMQLGHVGLIAGVVAACAHLPVSAAVPIGFVYALSLAWNINSVSHNFIHNPYFRSDALNRAFSLLLSVTNGFSQTMYHWVHMRHHSGNMDRPDARGETVDPISIYRHGRGGRPENVWAYAFLSFFRDDPPAIYRALRAKQPREAAWSLCEIAAVVAVYAALAAYDWRVVLSLVPFYYLGHSLSALNAYYEHFAGNPDLPAAWGVSSYGRIYNWTWLNNGYHAEHHYRPKAHWTDMPTLRRELAHEHKRANTSVMRRAHLLGFLEPLRPRHA